jgi:hypothetical protein
MHEKHEKHSFYDIHAISIDCAIALQLHQMRIQERMLLFVTNRVGIE